MLAPSARCLSVPPILHVHAARSQSAKKAVQKRARRRSIRWDKVHGRSRFDVLKHVDGVSENVRPRSIQIEHPLKTRTCAATPSPRRRASAGRGIGIAVETAAFPFTPLRFNET